MDVLASQVENSADFKKIMKAGQVTDAEIAELAARVNNLLTEAGDKLSPENFSLVAELISALTIFYAITNYNEKVK